MSARGFTIAWIVTLLALTAFILATPFLLPALARATGCERVGGACGAMMLVLGTFIRIPAIIVAGAVLGVVTWKRSRTVGLFPWAFVFVLVMYLAAGSFLLTFGNFWAVGFAFGVVSIPGFKTLAFLFVALTALGCLPSRGLETERLDPATMTVFVTGGIATVLAIPQLLMTLAMLPILGQLFRPLVLPAYYLTSGFYWLFGSWLMTGLLLAFAAAVAYLVVKARGMTIHPSRL